LITPRSADIHPVASSSQQKLSSAPPPYADENNNAGPQIDIHTDKGGEIGAQVSDYHYQEHDVANAEYMHQTGVKFGATLKGTETFNYGLFLSGDLRFAYSKNDYWSAPSGTINSFAGDFLGEGRVLIGEDLIFGDKPQSEVSFALAPYTGIGVRDLYNDSSKIKGGYRRNSEYFYVPLGLTDRFRITSNARISLNGEFDYLLLGRQTSYLNDATYNDPNVTNDQKHGYGVRGSIMYERESWAIGPFANYWNVNQSDYSIYKGTSCLPYYCGIWEPHNQTYEVGGEIRYRF
jgi:hypothetical protein